MLDYEIEFTLEIEQNKKKLRFFVFSLSDIHLNRILIVQFLGRLTDLMTLSFLISV